jgi:hypothetical protein
MMDSHLVILRNVSTTSLAVLVLGSALAGDRATAEQPSSVQNASARSQKACAARDLALVILLEERGESTTPHKLAAAFRDAVRARRACAEGDLAEALRIYDGAALSLSAD